MIRLGSLATRMASLWEAMTRLQPLLAADTLHCGDALSVLKGLPSKSVQTCVTSPPYFGLRDYGVDGQIGRESTLEDYVGKLVAVFGEVRRVLKDDGTVWLNLGDTYASTSVQATAALTAGAGSSRPRTCLECHGASP